MQDFHGYLFTNLEAVGTKSEGPVYFLQVFDRQTIRRVKVLKEVYPWEKDPTLHPFLDQKITILGDSQQDCIACRGIRADVPHAPQVDPELLELTLRLDPEAPNPLYVNKMPPGPNTTHLELTLIVKWPYRSIWWSLCPTSQVYDFFISDEDGVMKKWSDDQVFLARETPIRLIGEKEYAFTEVWELGSDIFADEGTYMATARFVAGGQSIEKRFEVKFARIEQAT